MKQTLLMVLIFGAGCVGTDVGNPQDLTDTKFILTTEVLSEPLPSALVLQGAVLDEAWISVRSVELRQDCSASRSETVIGPFFVDLLAAEPSPIPATLKAGEYCRIELNLDVDPAAPRPLRDRTLYLRGARADGVPFELWGERSDVLRFKGIRGKKMMLADRGSIIGDLAVFDWIAAGGLDEESAPVVVAEREDPATFNRFRNDLRTRSRLYGDVDGDGALVDDESRAIGEGE